MSKNHILAENARQTRSTLNLDLRHELRQKSMVFRLLPPLLDVVIRSNRDTTIYLARLFKRDRSPFPFSSTLTGCLTTLIMA